MTINTNDNHTDERYGDYEGVIKIVGQTQLPQEFITVGKSFQQALGRCTLLDERQRNAVIIYKAQLELFDMKEEIQDLTNWLNASTAIGGFNRSLAAMTHTGIYVPEGAGIKMDKDTKKAMIEMQRIKGEGHGNEEQKQDN